MAGRISIKDAGKFATGGNNDFFTLQDDGDVARVRFLYDDKNGEDLDYFLVHEVDISGKKRYVACNAIHDDGSLHPEDCPLCEDGNRRIEKLFLQLYDEDEDKVKTWDRGRTFVSKIMTYVNRYGSLVAQPIEIERRGKKGDTNTTYELFPMEVDGKTLSDFPEKQNLLGEFIIEATEEDMLDMIDGVYVIEGEEDKPKPRRRGSKKREPSREEKEDTTSRRSSRREKSDSTKEEGEQKVVRRGRRGAKSNEDQF